MESGYTRLYRKIWKNAILAEKNKTFSRFEAWLYLVNVQAQGTDRPGIKRGEFEVSIRYLARAWNWSKTKVERFLADLQAGETPMIMRLGHESGHFAGHFTICEYETYNPTRDTNRDTLRDKLNKRLNKRLKEDSPAEPDPTPSALFDIFDQENQNLPKLIARSQDRLAKCRTRINQAVKSGCLEAYIADFRKAVQKAQTTPFLCGTNPRGWRANFDWFVENQTNPYKVLEGKYDGAGSAPPSGNGHKDTIGQSQETTAMDPEQKRILQKIYAIEDPEERKQAIREYNQANQEEEI